MFHDRADAGGRLGALLCEQQWSDPLVLGIARGGIPVGAAVAGALGAELDVVLARKVGAPGQPELGVAAVTAHGPVVERAEAARQLGMRRDDLLSACARERETAKQLEQRYRQGPAAKRSRRDVIVVDDGLATGVTAMAVLRAERAARPARLVLAAPTCAPQIAEQLGAEADWLTCLHLPAEFHAVGESYQRFEQLTDEDVAGILHEHRSV